MYQQGLALTPTAAASCCHLPSGSGCSSWLLLLLLLLLTTARHHCCGWHWRCCYSSRRDLGCLCHCTGFPWESCSSQTRPASTRRKLSSQPDQRSLECIPETPITNSILPPKRPSHPQVRRQLGSPAVEEDLTDIHAHGML